MNESTSQRPERERIVVADREPSVRGALGALATQCLDMNVVGEACTAEALRCQAQLLNPQLVVVAWELLHDATESLPAAIRRSAQDVRIVVLGIRPEFREAAFGAGADGFVSVADRPEVVVRVLRSCLEPGRGCRRHGPFTTQPAGGAR